MSWLGRGISARGRISRYAAGGLSSGRCTWPTRNFDVPRVRNVANHTEVPLDVYQALQTPRQMDEGLLLRMLKGIATRNYEACAEAEGLWSVILIGVPSLRERHGSKAG